MSSRTELRATCALAALLAVASPPASAEQEPLAGAWIRGRVLSFDGGPLAGARAELRPVESEVSRVRRRLSRRAGAGSTAAGSPASGGSVATSFSNASGVFVLRAETAGPFVVRISGAGRLPQVCRPIPTAGPLDLPPVSLVEATAELVELRAPDGRPATDTWVGVRSSPRPGTLGQASCWLIESRAGWTDAAGRFSVLRAAGEEIELVVTNRWGRVVTRLGDESRQAPAELDSQWPFSDVRELEAVVARRGEGVVPGAVLSAAGAPIARSDGHGRARVWVPLAAGDSSGVVHPIEGPVLRVLAADGWGASWTRAELQRLLDVEPGLESASRSSAESLVRLIVLPPVEVSGTVVDRASGEPIRAALVRVGDRLVRTGATGRFALPAPAGRRIGLGASATGYRSQRSVIETPVIGAPGARRRLSQRIALEPATILEGWVVDREHRPVPWAEVAVRKAGSRDGGIRQPASWTRSGDDGGFRLTEVPANTVVEVTAATAARPTEPQVTLRLGTRQPRSRRGDVLLQLTPRRSVFGWVVTDRGGVERPVAGAEIRLLPSRIGAGGGVEAIGAVTSDEAGRFAVSLVPSGLWDLLVEARGFARARVAALEVAVGSGPQELGTVLLDPESLLELRLIDDQREPVAGAEVRIRWAGDERDLRGVFRSDLAGEVSIGGLRPRERIGLWIHAAGFVDAEPQNIPVPEAGAASEPIEVVLQHGAEVAGRVVDRRGDPVADAHVAALAVDSLKPTPSGLFRRTAADGTFRLPGVPPGRVRVTARKPALALFVPLEVELRPGEVVDDMVLRERESAVVEGRVTMNGEGVADAVVVAAERLAETDADGRFRLERVALGTHQLEVRPPGRKPVQRTVEVGAAGAELEIVLGELVEVSGRVIARDGTPLGGMNVSLRGERGSRRLVTSAGDGSFRADLEEGRYRVAASGGRWAMAGEALDVVLEPGRPMPALELVLRRGAELQVQVYGLERGERAVISLEQLDGPGRSYGMGTNRAGFWTSSSIEPGRWTVRARRSSRTPASADESSRQVEIGPDDEVVTVELTLGDSPRDEGLRIEGSVRVGGAPVAGAWLLASSGSDGFGAVATTDFVGRFELCCLAAGVYDLQVASLDTALAHVRTIDVRGDVALELELERVRVRGSVVDPGGAPVEAATVTVIGFEEPSVSRPSRLGTGADGRFLIEALMERGGRLRIEHPSYRPQMIDLGAAVGDLELPPVVLLPR